MAACMEVWGKVEREKYAARMKMKLLYRVECMYKDIFEISFAGGLDRMERAR